MNRRNVYLFGASMLAFAYTMPASAQEMTETPEERAAGINDIVVTAQKRAQNLQDVSTAISAFTGSALQDAGVTNVQSLQTLVPNITIGTSFGYANLFVRGLGLNSVFANVDSSVTLYEDGAVISQPAAQLFSFFDLERVEVLRGPQGTLYGRNATGGTINLITAEPTRQFDAFARLDVGNYASIESEGAISGPITDTLSARVAYFFSTRDGFGKNIVTGRDVNDYNARSIRAKLAFEPSPDFSLSLTGQYGRENDKANALQFKRETYPGVLTDSNPANDGLVSPGAGGFPMTGDPRDYASDVDPSNERETWSITGIAKWTVNDIITVTNILNYRKFTMDLVQDLDLSSVRTSSIQDFVFDSEQLSEELQLSLDLDRLQVLGGFYYFTENLDHQNSISAAAKVGEFDTNAVGNGRRVFLTGNGDTDTWALFWNANFELNDQITLKGGGRFTSDRRAIDNENWIWIPAAAAAACAPGTIVTAPFGGRVQCYNPTLDDKRTFRDYTNEAGIEWRPTDDVMAYYTYSEGFKAGTGQLGTTQTALPLIIRPETIKNHEIGLKSSFDDGRIVFNVSAYTYKINDIQLDRAIPGGPSGFTTIFENATSQKAKGIEVDAIWQPSDVFRAHFSAALQDTKFGSFLTTNPTNPGIFNPADPTLPEDIRGNKARNAPGFAGSLQLEYDIPLDNGGKFTLSGDGAYKGRQYFSEFNDPLLSQKGYTILNARIAYAFPDGRWQASVWGKNLADKTVESASFALATGRATGRTLEAPRTYGMSIHYNY